MPEDLFGVDLKGAASNASIHGTTVARTRLPTQGRADLLPAGRFRDSSKSATCGPAPVNIVWTSLRRIERYLRGAVRESSIRSEKSGALDAREAEPPKRLSGKRRSDRGCLKTRTQPRARVRDQRIRAPAARAPSASATTCAEIKNTGTSTIRQCYSCRALTIPADPARPASTVAAFGADLLSVQRGLY